MRKDIILVTGAAGEMGQALITRLSDEGAHNILALDVNPVPDTIRARCQMTVMGDITDEKLIQRLITEYETSVIFHLAALLSTRAEFNPEMAHRVNVAGTVGLLQMAINQSQWLGKEVRFVFPSSIAVYGLPDLQTKHTTGAVKEHKWNQPITMYGCNKLYAEHLGRYYSRHYKQLAAIPEQLGVDFRAIRFPGLISAFTMPTGGTSDYGPEMLHHAAKGEPYPCFVREDTRIGFMAMPDAVKALIQIAEAEQARLTSHVYNISAFSLSAAEIAEQVHAAFPAAEITYKPHEKRQRIVDTWPMDQDDALARTDWDWHPGYNAQRAFEDYLIPNITARYR